MLKVLYFLMKTLFKLLFVCLFYLIVDVLYNFDEAVFLFYSVVYEDVNGRRYLASAYHTFLILIVVGKKLKLLGQ